MIVILKHNAQQEQVDKLKLFLLNQGLRIDESRGDHSTILGLVGDTSRVDADLIASLDAVEAVRRVQEPYKKANRKFHPEDTVVDCGGVKCGGGTFQIIAGPCSVETEEQIVTVAKSVKEAGATLLRGGAFKPRTSPYAFQGLHGDGLRLLKLAKQETGLPIVTEIMDASHLDQFDDVDVIQVGARNMQNFELLKVLGRTRKPILLKRGLANTIQESSCASAASAPTRRPPAIPSTCPACPSCGTRPTCPSSSTPATPPASPSWSSLWRWQRPPAVPTA